MPLSPNASLGLPVFASREKSLSVARAEHDLRRRLRVAGPVFDTPRRRTARGSSGRPTPLCRSSGPARRRGQMARRGTSRHRRRAAWFRSAQSPSRVRVPPRPCGGAPGRGGARQGGAGLQVIHPGHFQLADIRRRDLRDGRKAHAAGIVPVGRPFRSKRVLTPPGPEPPSTAQAGDRPQRSRRRRRGARPEVASYEDVPPPDWLRRF